MGLFDYIHVTCPKCDDQMVTQSKAGPCAMRDFSPDSVPIEIAKDVEGETIHCETCDRSYIIVVDRTTPETVPIFARVKSARDSARDYN